MPGCAAPNCTNSSAKGFLMKVFPRDPQRRSLWATEVKRENWKPTNTSFLCEAHFDADQWEKVSIDGKRKLKHRAIPTLFDRSKPAMKRRRRSPQRCGTSIKISNNPKRSELTPEKLNANSLVFQDHCYGSCFMDVNEKEKLVFDDAPVTVKALLQMATQPSPYCNESIQLEPGPPENFFYQHSISTQIRKSEDKPTDKSESSEKSKTSHSSESKVAASSTSESKSELKKSKKKNRVCEECDATKRLKFQVVFQRKKHYLCSDVCCEVFKNKQKCAKYSAEEPKLSDGS